MSACGSEPYLLGSAKEIAGNDTSLEVIPLPSQRRNYHNQTDLHLDVVDAYVVSFTNLALVMDESIPCHNSLRQRVPTNFALNYFAENYLESAQKLAATHKRVMRGRCMDRLPIELIGEIFRFASLDNDWPYTGSNCDVETLLAISHSCRFWRAVTISTPSLWTSVEHPNPQIVELFLDRSKVCLIQVIFDLTACDEMESDFSDDDSSDDGDELSEDALIGIRLITLLIPHLHRTRSLQLISTTSSFLQTVLQCCTDVDAPHLERLVISTLGWPVDFRSSLLAIPLTNTSSLRTLQCYPLAMNPDLRIIGSQIRALEVSFSSTIWDCLGPHLPALTRATFFFERQFVTPRRGCQISLNALTTLTLTVHRRHLWAECFKFLDHVFCPLLVTLTINCSIEVGSDHASELIHPAPRQSNFPSLFELDLFAEQPDRSSRQSRALQRRSPSDFKDTYRILLRILARVPTVLCLKFRGDNANIFLSLISNPPIKPVIPALVKIHFEHITGAAIGRLVHLIRVRYCGEEYSAIGSLWIGHCLSQIRGSGQEWAIAFQSICAMVRDVQVFCKDPKCPSRCYVYPPRNLTIS